MAARLPAGRMRSGGLSCLITWIHGALGRPPMCLMSAMGLCSAWAELFGPSPTRKSFSTWTEDGLYGIPARLRSWGLGAVMDRP